MKFGMREAVDVVFKAKAPVTIGNTTFAKDEPVIYFDSLKTSTTEGAATTVYAQGGKGNPRLIAWEGDKTITFTFEDALISVLGISVLTGAGLVEAGVGTPITVHRTAKVDVTVGVNGAISVNLTNAVTGSLADEAIFAFVLDAEDEIVERLGAATSQTDVATITFTSDQTDGKVVTIMVDFYEELTSGAQEITIAANEFAGYYYIEGDTLFRRQNDGVDVSAQIIIPNAKIQSNFTFTMAPTGDPSTFTFTADAFPGFIKGGDEKVLYGIQLID